MEPVEISVGGSGIYFQKNYYICKAACSSFFALNNIQEWLIYYIHIIFQNDYT